MIGRRDRRLPSGRSRPPGCGRAGDHATVAVVRDFDAALDLRANLHPALPTPRGLIDHHDQDESDGIVRAGPDHRVGHYRVGFFHSRVRPFLYWGRSNPDWCVTDEG